MSCSLICCVPDVSATGRMQHVTLGLGLRHYCLLDTSVDQGAFANITTGRVHLDRGISWGLAVVPSLGRAATLNSHQLAPAPTSSHRLQPAPSSLHLLRAPLQRASPRGHGGSGAGSWQLGRPPVLEAATHFQSSGVGTVRCACFRVDDSPPGSGVGGLVLGEALAGREGSRLGPRGGAGTLGRPQPTR